MRCIPLIVLSLAVPFLTAGSCASTPERPVIPEVVHVPVKDFVPLDPKLTADCIDEAAKSQELGEATRLANVRREYLAECTGRLRQIRALQPAAPAVKP